MFFKANIPCQLYSDFFKMAAVKGFSTSEVPFICLFVSKSTQVEFIGSVKFS